MGEINRFLAEYAASGTVRMHMPGHKGRLDPLDITEIAGADSLYEADGIIERSENRMAACYGADATAYSAGGSTLCIQAMLALARERGTRVLCTRNLHTSAVNAMMLLGMQPVFLPVFQEDPRLPGFVAPETLRAALRGDEAAVYLTTPDYFGRQMDVAALARVCRERDVPLLVDNAHGAHLRFLTPDRHPMTSGASACADSPHKTLPALTGAALLHLRLPFGERRKAAMALFGSTSPSYLILRSLDQLLEPMENGELRSSLSRLNERCAELKTVLSAHGLPSVSADPTRLVLDANAAGYTGTALANAFREARIEPEYADRAFVVLLPSVCTPDEDWNRLHAFAEKFRPSAPIHWTPPTFELPESAMTLREAAFLPSESVAVEAAVGRIAARSVSPCPPGVPVVLPGERLSDDLCRYLRATGHTEIRVLTEK